MFSQFVIELLAVLRYASKFEMPSHTARFTADLVAVMPYLCARLLFCEQKRNLKGTQNDLKMFLKIKNINF